MERPYRNWVGVGESIDFFYGPHVSSDIHGTALWVGRSGRRLVLAVHVEDPHAFAELPSVLRSLIREVRGWREAKLVAKGFVVARPVAVGDKLVFQLEEVLNGPFKHRCVPPIAGSRWWRLMRESDNVYAYVLTEEGEKKVRAGLSNWYTISLCKAILGLQFGLLDEKRAERAWPSPVGPPLSIPGAGSLSGAELPVVRHRDRYLRVGPWLAWHRVLGILDDGKWVIIGDDGLYEAEFIPTVKYPLEEFGEVGYVRVLGPYGGDVDDVQSPCGAPRLVACTEDTREALISAGHSCNEGGGIPHVLLGSGDAIKLGREVIDWPLRDPCDLLTQFPFVFNPVL